MRYQPKALLDTDPLNKVEPVIEATTRELWYEIEGDNGGTMCITWILSTLNIFTATGTRV